MGQKHRKLLLAGSLLLVNVLVFMIALAKTNEMVKMPVAKEAILPRMKITEEMVAYIEVPKQAVRNNMYQSKKAIIGKVAAIEGLIPKGSFFYKGAIEASDTLKDAPALALKKGQSAFSLSCILLISAGNSIVAFQHVDVYVTIDDRSAGMKSDVLLQNVRVLSIKDRKGKELGKDDDGVPYVCVLAVQDEQIPLLQKALEMGSVDIYAIHTSAYRQPEAVLKTSSEVLEVLR